MPSARRWLVAVAAALAGAVALYALVGYVVAPGLLRDRIAQALAAELERPVRIERVDVRPFALAATVHGLAVDRREGGPLLTVEAIEADASIASLRHLAPVVDSLRVVRPHLRVARLSANRYDVSDIVDRWLAPSAAPPAKFSLNNIEVTGGRVDFDDRPVRRAHVVEAIDVGVPFLSSLPYDAEVRVQPRFAARVNGTPFALTGQATPFAQRREVVLDVDVDGLPLAAYVDYVPAKLRFVVADGRLGTRLRVAFAQSPGGAPELTVSGRATLAALDLRRPDKAPLAAWRELRVGVERLDPNARLLRLSAVEVDGPALAVRRLPGGALELAGPWMDAAPAEPPASAAAPWRVEVAEVVVQDGRASIDDASIDPPYRAAVTALAAKATSLATGPERSGRVTATFRIDDEASARLEADVALAPFAAAGRFEVANARLARLYPYAAQALDLAIQKGSADYASSFELAADGAVRLTGGRGTLRDVALAVRGERVPMWVLPEVAADGVDVDVAKRSVAVATVAAKRPQAVLARDASGTWNAARLLRRAPEGAPAEAAEGTWQVRLARAAVERGDLRYSDATTQPPLALRVSEIALGLTDVGTTRERRSALDLRARVDAAGRIAVKGPFVVHPVYASFDVDAERLPLLAAKPLIEARANVVVTGGTASARGRLDVGTAAAGGTRVAWNGDVTLADVEALDPPTGGRLFAWRSLALQKAVARSDPPEANVAAVALDDFYARLIVYADGSINLAKLAKEGGASAPPAAAAPAVAAQGGRAQAPGAVASAAHTAERTLRSAVDGALPIAVGRIALARGNVNFSDYFIRPNYSANLTQVAGSISALSPTQAGAVAITALVDDAAPVTIEGRIQPFARELSLALAAKARDIELPPLSPYAAKYAGYGITKGKMSFDVDYTIADRKLEAKNRLVLDQLTFGERVDSPDATKLPVLLAVALLKDVNGVIDLELPISGTLDDPQFSVFGLIVRVVVNLLTKAATAPFALLGAVAGGGEELATLAFGAGSAALDAGDAERLDKLAKALTARPALKVDVTGRTDAASDAEALARAAVERALRAAKLKALAGKPEAPLSIDTVVIGADERAKWLAAAYAALPAEARTARPEAAPAEVEAILVARAQPDAAALAELGLARARTAKEALVARGVPAERVYLVAAGGAAPAATKGGPRRVDFALR